MFRNHPFRMSPDGLLHDNPDDRLPPPGDGNVPPPPPPAHANSLARPTCEFCGCRLTHTGEILAHSDKAKKYRRQDDTIEELQTKVSALETQLREARTKLAEHEPRTSADSGGLHL